MTTKDHTNYNSIVIPTEVSANKETIILRPISTVENIIETYREYNNLKDRLLIDSDYQLIRWKKCIKKAGFRKLATAFWISTEITRENRVNLDGYFIYEITCRATAPSGRYSEACASCASNERDFTHLENDVRATAQTRATNRAISDLIGTGEISAEEIDEWLKGKTTVDNEKLSDDAYIPYHETDAGKNHYASMKNRNNSSEDLQLWEETFLSNDAINENSKTESNSSEEPITTKQRHLLIRLIETRYQNEQDRSSLFKKMNILTKTEARFAIQKMLA